MIIEKTKNIFEHSNQKEDRENIGREKRKRKQRNKEKTENQR